MNVCFWIIVLHFVLEAIVEALENKLKYNKYKIVSVIVYLMLEIFVLYTAIKTGF